MSYGFRIFDDRLAGPLHGWGRRTSGVSWAVPRAAPGLRNWRQSSGLDERAVAWLLDEPVVARLVRPACGLCRRR
ncbi:MAG: hypothetical protein R3D03_14155 [Geminicoccaceae bacterium]